jgi:hypothetical protein
VKAIEISRCAQAAMKKDQVCTPIHEERIGKGSKQNYCRFAYQNNDLRSVGIEAPLLG